MHDPATPPRPASYDKAVGLVLQGGGALGSYQAGVYAVLARSEYHPDWVAGISIGAINAALIAGNPPETRVAKLRAFWDEVTEPTAHWPPFGGQAGLTGPFDMMQRDASAMASLLFGQPGFFKPRAPLEWLQPHPPTSYYDTTALKRTLERLVDFDRINAGAMRFSVGAVEVCTGNFAYFDNANTRIRPEHIMASGALPPGFPAVEIDGKHYWDGGMVSNTPLDYMLDTLPRRSRIVFQVDVFSARGPLPTTLDEVGARDKDIRYSSRTRAVTNHFCRIQDVRHNINELLEKLPAEFRRLPEAEFLYQFGCVTTMDIVQLVYRPATAPGASKDYEFGRATMSARWAQGEADATTTLTASPWLAPIADDTGARSFDVVFEATMQHATPKR